MLGQAPRGGPSWRVQRRIRTFPKGTVVAHHIAEWLGIPVVVVIVAMLVLRRAGKALQARRKQARAEKASAVSQPASSDGAPGE